MVFGRYRIPEDDETPFVNMYLPKSVDWVSQANWLFGDLGDFYVAVRPLADYTWEHIQEARNDGTMVHDGDLIDGWLLRMADLNPGLVLEAVEAGDAGDWVKLKIITVEMGTGLIRPVLFLRNF